MTHGLQHARLPCPSPTPKACSNSHPWSRWCHQPSYPLLSPSPPAFNLSQNLGLFQWVSSSHQVAKVLYSSYFFPQPSTKSFLSSFYFTFIWLHQIVAACRIFSCGMWDLVPRPGIKPMSPQWEHEVLATGPPEKSQLCSFWLDFMSRQSCHTESLTTKFPSKNPFSSILSFLKGFTRQLLHPFFLSISPSTSHPL